MRLATSTGDFAPYTQTQEEALAHIRAAGFLYADYNFCTDHARRGGIYTDDFAGYLKSVARTARRLGICLVQAHAPMGRPFEDGGALLNDTLPDLLRMVEYIGHPLFHAVLDVGHANMQSMPQDEAIRLLGRHLYALHVQDNMGDVDTHLTPFLGTVNMDEVMTGLADIGYRGYFTFEVGGFFLPADKRRAFDRNTSLASAPIELRDAFERYLYELGKCVLKKYGCFEE